MICVVAVLCALCVKRHWMPVWADQWVVPSWIYSYHSVAPQCFTFLEPLNQSLCLKWLQTFLVISSIKRLQRETKWSVHLVLLYMSASWWPHDPPMLWTQSLHSPQLSSFPTLSLLSLLWDGRHTNCCDQHYGHTLLSLLNKLVAFYWAARHGGESVLALLLYWHLKKINCAQGGFQLVNSYYNSASFMYN